MTSIAPARCLPFLLLALVLSACGGGTGTLQIDGTSGTPVPLTGPVEQVGTTDGPNLPLDIAPVTEADATAAERSLLAEINAARSKPRTCGTKAFAATSALNWDARLAGAAKTHSDDMAHTGYREETPAEPDAPHKGSDGSSPQDRIDRAGYLWTTSGENVAAGFKPAAVVAAWLASPSHCANVMNPTYVDTGISLVNYPGAVYTTFYTETFGRAL